MAISRHEARLRARRVRVRTMDPLVLGSRIRHARIAAGLTQSEICAGIASTAYLSRIEAGQRRPSLEVLDGFAERISVPVDDLLDLEAADVSRDLRLALARAQLHLAAGDTRVAIAAARAAERKARAASLEDPARAARLITARSLLHDDRAREAADLITLDTLRPDHGAASVRALVTFARCQVDLGAATIAVESGIRAADLVTEHALDGLPEAVETALALSDALTAAGLPDLAASVCADAATRVPDVATTVEPDAPFRRASEHEYRAGAWDDALLHAERAVVLLEIATYRAGIAELWARAEKYSGPAGND